MSIDKRLTTLLCLLVPELEVIPPGNILTITTDRRSGRLQSIFMFPSTGSRYDSGWHMEWLHKALADDIDELIAEGYLAPAGQNQYKINAARIIRDCK